MKEKFIYEGGRGMREEGMREGFHAHPYPRMRAPKGALYTEGFK